jgi:hypothetical protein
MGELKEVPARVVIRRCVKHLSNPFSQLRVERRFDGPFRFGDIAVQAAIEVDAACLEGDHSEVVPVYLSETWREVGDHAPQRVSGVEASFSLESRNLTPDIEMYVH